MTAVDIAASLAALKPRFLDGLMPPELTSVVAAATTRQFAANELLAEQEVSSKYLFLILSGRARYFFTTPDGQKVVLLWLPPGEICGAAAILANPKPYLVSTEAVEDTCALVWERKAIRSLADRYPRLAENTLLVAFDSLVAYRGAHIALICHTARERLARVLVNLASGMGKKVPGGLELNIRNEELANEANVTLFTTSRFLNEWQRMGIVEKSRGKVVVRSLERLSARNV